MESTQSSPGKSLIREIEQLREAVLRLCELQQELAKKLDAALESPSRNKHHEITIQP